MAGQLCFDFDDNPITLERVNQYLTANPQVDGFRVADLALSGRAADAIIAMRASIEQGTAPIALIGALAMKLRTMPKPQPYAPAPSAKRKRKPIHGC